MKVYLITYADKKYINSQKINKESGLKCGFDDVFAYNRKDIDDVFLIDNSNILNLEKGAGLWLWKSYFLLKTLDKLNDGDFIWYNDSGAVFINDIKLLINEIIEEDIILFSTGQFRNSQFTKKDCFYYMDCNNEYYYNTSHLQASTQIYKKSKNSYKFISEYLKYCLDERIITDNVNTCGLDDCKDYITHRHDQSILSLLFHKYKDEYKLKLHKDPTQYPVPNDKYQSIIKFDDKYPQIINHTRL